MITKFPAQIDAFPIRVPQEIIRAEHVNDIQDSVVAIEVSVKSLEQSLNAHKAQVSSAHMASAIGVENITGVLTTNLQITLADLKSQIDIVSGSISPAISASVLAHVNTNLDEAHPNGEISGQRINNTTITGDKIAPAAILESHLGFDIVELNAHISTEIASAHTGEFPISRLDIPVATSAELSNHISTDIASAHPGEFPISRLDIPVATSAQLLSHSISTDVHGVDGEIVGTLNSQVLENKKIISDFQGSKITLFTDEVTSEEKIYYNTSDLGSPQIEIRNKSAQVITGVDHSGSYSIIYVDGLFFNDIVSLVSGIQFIELPHTPLTYATITSVSSNSITLDAIYNTLAIGHIAVNTLKAKPVFQIDNEGSVTIRELHVVDNSFNDIDFKQDILIDGNLTVIKESDLRGFTKISDSLEVTGSVSVGTELNVGTDLSAESVYTDNLNATGDTNIGGKLLVDQNVNFGDDLRVEKNVRIDGYLSVENDISSNGGLSIMQDLHVGLGAIIDGDLSANNLEIFNDATINNNLHVRNGLIVDGYANVTGNLTIEGDLIVLGATSLAASNISTVDNFIYSDGYNVQVVLEDLDKALNNETSSRIAADIILQTSINNESSTRSAIDDITLSEIDAIEGALGFVDGDGNFILFGSETNYLDTALDAYESFIALDTAINNEVSLRTVAVANATVVVKNDGLTINSSVKNMDYSSEFSVSNVNANSIYVASSPWLSKSGTYTAKVGDKILADTTGGGFTITLPSSPSDGYSVKIADPRFSWSVNSLTIGRNGKNINNLASDFIISTPDKTYEFVFYALTNNWIILKYPGTYGG